MQNAKVKNQNDKSKLKIKNSAIQRKYFRRAKVVAFILQAAPFVRMVGLNGSLARGEAKITSDIDFLIIAQRRRIWTCRAFVTIMTYLTGLRRYGNKIAGRICLNRYQTDDFLEIKPHDRYHSRVFSNLIPLFETEGTYLKYIFENQWIRNWGQEISCETNLKKNIFIGIIRKIGEKILSGKLGDLFEDILKNYQKKRILSDLRTKIAPKGRVRVSDRELCFHPLKDNRNS